MSAPYRLRCQIFGHEKDVRSVVPSISPENGIISGSRDITSRVWMPNENDNGFQEGHVMSGHKNFVAVVCAVPPDDKYPHGLIYTGSNDATILAYTLDSPEPMFTLKDHSSTVCALASGKFGTLLSGSWDKTAKVWLNQKCVMTLEGHGSAVWAVAILPAHGLMLTGSADKTIKLWKAGKCEKTFKGHEDCVRGLAVTQGTEFLSCSNDGTVRRWLVSGECLAVYYGHENFVYSIAVLPDGQDFVSSGEDRTVRVWRNGECCQTIPHPTQSIWTVCALSNGDIVSGASDGVIRVFTTDPSRAASAEEQKALDDQIASSTLPTQVGDIKSEDLPGPEALLNPGKKDGQTKMVKGLDGKIEVYSWESGISEWKKIGDVVGSAGGTPQSSGKSLFEGKEYDYVFTVDIEEGKPPLKLPYDISEDPWFAAQKFLDKNNLSQLFLDQVANFIVDNTKGVTLNQGPPGVGDPFTGGSRYVPGSDTNQFGGAPGDSDPFTGGGRYVPSYRQEQRGSGDGAADPFTGASSYRTGSGPASTGTTTTNQYFPQSSFVTFDTANAAQIVGKLKEFNSGVEDLLKVPESSLDAMSDLVTAKSADSKLFDTLHILLQWPPKCVFPALDVVRMCVRQPETNKTLCSNNNLLDNMLSYWSDDSLPANQMLSLRTICNMFAHAPGQKLNAENRDRIISMALNCRETKNKNVQIALATLLLNHAVQLKGSSEVENKAQCFVAAATALQSQPDGEATFRLLVCIGTLVTHDSSLVAMGISLDLNPVLEKLKTVSEPKKVGECASLLLGIFK